MGRVSRRYSRAGVSFLLPWLLEGPSCTLKVGLFPGTYTSGVKEIKWQCFPPIVRILLCLSASTPTVFSVKTQTSGHSQWKTSFPLVSIPNSNP